MFLNVFTVCVERINTVLEKKYHKRKTEAYLLIFKK